MAGAFSMAFGGRMHLPRGIRDICILIAPQAASATGIWAAGGEIAELICK